MSKLLELREWLTVAEAAEYLSERLKETVSAATLLRLCLDGHITLSAHIPHPVPASFGSITIAEEAAPETAAAKEHDPRVARSLESSPTWPPRLTVFPARPDALGELSKLHTDPTVLALARKGVSLDIFSQLGFRGGLEIFRRERAALVTHTAAMSQDSDLVACILYVVTAECLTTPDAPWRDARLTKRFIEFFDSLMPTDLDAIVAHANFEDAFGIRRGARSARSLRRELLDRIYEYRSGLVHGGLTPTYRGLGSAVETGGILRRALFSAFAEGAILSYLRSPRSSLIGHPAFEASPAAKT